MVGYIPLLPGKQLSEDILLIYWKQDFATTGCSLYNKPLDSLYCKYHWAVK